MHHLVPFYKELVCFSFTTCGPLYELIISITVEVINRTPHIHQTSRLVFPSAIFNEITNEAIAEATFVHSNNNERLMFHEHCGTLIKLTNGRRTAERKRPLDEFNNGVVMTNRPLRDEEMFEVSV